MTATGIQQLSPDLCVAPQLGPGAMTWLAQQGFKSIINNRPDFEAGPDQPTSATMQIAAVAAGLSYAYLPVASGYQSPDEIARFAELLATMPRPILAYCRSGMRSGRLFYAAAQG